MPNTKYTRGREKEWAIQHLFRDLGYSTARTSGSHGAWDVHVTSKTEARYIQCKRQKDGKISLADYEEALKKLEEYELPDPQHPRIYKELWVWLDHKGWFCYRLVNGHKGPEFIKVEVPTKTTRQKASEKVALRPHRTRAPRQAQQLVLPLPRSRPRGLPLQPQP